MKVAKIKRKEDKRVECDADTYSIKGIIKILFWLLLVFSVFYFITVLLVNNKTVVEDEESVAVIDSSKIILNNLLNQKQEEYYVIATKASIYDFSYINTDYISLYKNYINEYTKEDDALKFYYVDLDNALNKKYNSDKLNISEDVENLKLNDEVLFKIKDGRIEKYYVGKEQILEKLSRL